MIQNLGKSVVVVLSVLLLANCAQERPVKNILANGRRILKKDLEGTYLFQKMVTNVKFAGGKREEGIPAGRYVIADVLVQLKVSENLLEIVSIDPLFQEERAALENTTLATFAIKNVDVLRKQNADGEDTNEEEETDTRRPWNQRDYISVLTETDASDSLGASTKVVKMTDIAIDNGAINFSVTRVLRDDAEVTQSYSLLKYAPSSTFEQKEYPLDLQTKFGFFKTQTVKFDKYGRITQSDRKEFMNRWDTNKKIVYYLSPNYPKHLISATKHVFAKWNEAFKAATGKDTVEIRENTGQQLGDLRYSMITFDETQDAAHGILGYGPSYTNPRTGEIVKGDVILYGGVLKQVVFRERIWEALLNGAGTDSPNPADKERVQALKSLRASRESGASLDLSLLSKVGSLVSQRQVDRDLISSLRKDFAPAKMAKEMKDLAKSPFAKNTTMLSENIFEAVKDNVSKMSDEDLEKVIFIPLLTHELGHNFGLRHNFMGSADHDHFGEGAKTSSVMDYGFLSSQEGTEPGLYDKAAIVVGYSGNNQRIDSLSSDNYFFCTDEDTFSSQTAMCNQFDAGNTLSEVASNQINRYRAGFVFNNTRLDRVFFNQSNREYVQRVIRNILPLRFQYDHAKTMLEKIERKDLNAIWLLARQRVEADPKSRAGDIVPIKVLAGFKVVGSGADLTQVPVMVERKVDTAKIALLKLDATVAKSLTLEALRDIVLDKTRGDFGVYDQIQGEMLVRGVLIDKMLTMDLLGARMSSPMMDGTVSTTFPSADEEAVMPTLFRQVISNLVLPGEPGSNPDPNAEEISFDINLREMAIEIIRDELSAPSLAVPMRKLIATERITPDKNNDQQKKLAEFNTKMRGLLKKLYKGGLAEADKTALIKEINATDNERARTIPFAQTEVIGDQVFKANIAIDSFDMLSASGVFILRTVNLYEQIAGGMTDARDEIIKDLRAELAKPEAEQKKELIEQLKKQATDMSKTVLLVNQIVELNRTFVDMMQKAFDPR